MSKKSSPDPRSSYPSSERFMYSFTFDIEAFYLFWFNFYVRYQVYGIAMDCQLTKFHLLKTLSFLYGLAFVPLSKPVGHACPGLFLGSV